MLSAAERCPGIGWHPQTIDFPLIPKEETGVIRPVTRADLDEMFALDDFAS